MPTCGSHLSNKRRRVSFYLLQGGRMVVIVWHAKATACSNRRICLKPHNEARPRFPIFPFSLFRFLFTSF